MAVAIIIPLSVSVIKIKTNRILLQHLFELLFVRYYLKKLFKQNCEKFYGNLVLRIVTKGLKEQS